MNVMMSRMCHAAFPAIFLWASCLASTAEGSAHPDMNTSCLVNLTEATDATSEGVRPVLQKYEAALLMVLGFGGFSVMLALIYSAIRKYVYHDSHSLDTFFNAGGRVSLSLTAVTVTSQLLWPADFLQSSTNAVKTGPAGSLWFSVAIVIDILLFPMLSVHLKTRAPGAKTFLQIIHARFGKPAHIVYCFVALGANVITTTSLVLAGKAAIQTLTVDASDEFVVLILAVLFGSYCFIGGLGTTFYISYFNTALTFITMLIFIVKAQFLQEDHVSEFASKEALYEAMTCVPGPEGNYENSYKTFRSRTGVIMGVVLLFVATSISFCDQANWQSRIAAKPAQGVMGFFIAAYVWFAIPTSVSLMSAMTYLSLSYQNGSHLLTTQDINAGFATPFVMEKVMGQQAGYLLLTMLTMALMSTGSGEVMAVSSIFVYDIYKIYINPFRKGDSPTSCQLCGKEKSFHIDKKTDDNGCTCATSQSCADCDEDINLRLHTKQLFGLSYKCGLHGRYRHYEDLLIHYKSWSIMWVVVAIVPFGLVIMSSGVDLNWAVMTGQVFMSPFLVPLLLTLAWAKTTGAGVIAGGLSGLIGSIAALLSVGSTYDGGLGNFLVNTSMDYSLLAGVAAGLGISTIVCVVTSMCTHKIKCKDDGDNEWRKTMSIDNPINTWRALYQEELDEINVGEKDHVDADVMAKVFRKARLIAYVGGAISLVLFIVVLPGVMLSFDTLSMDQFYGWTIFCQVWVMIGAVFVIIVPPVEEVLQIIKASKNQKQKQKQKENTTISLQNQTGSVNPGFTPSELYISNRL